MSDPLKPLADMFTVTVASMIPPSHEFGPDTVNDSDPSPAPQSIDVRLSE